MWEALPRLYWRVKIGNRWKYIPAVYDLHLGKKVGSMPACTHPLGENVTLWWPSPSELRGEEGESDESV